MTPHNEAELGDIAKTVLMPGDPKRAEFISKTYLEDSKLVNDVRGMKAYTGIYKGKRITVMASGMGIPSMGIYSYELYKYYDVDTIIRIGSCGNYSNELNLLDLILVDSSYTESNYALTLNNEDCHLVYSSDEVNKNITNTAKDMKLKIACGTIFTSECFDLYMTDKSKCFERMPKGINVLGAEMESFALLYNAKLLGKKAGCILTVVDDEVHNTTVDSLVREKALTQMMELGLEVASKE